MEALESRIVLDGVAVDLLPSSDSGASDSDNITNQSMPNYEVTVDRGGVIRIDWENDGTFDLTAPVAAAGAYVYSPSSALADGLYPVTVQFTDDQSNVWTATSPTTIDTTGTAKARTIGTSSAPT